MRTLIILLVAVIFFSCAGKKGFPKDVLKPETMQAVFWDYIRADVFASDIIKKDSTKIAAVENLKLQNRLFSMHHITRETFYKSYTYYTGHPDLMQTMLDSMIIKESRIRNQAREMPKKVYE